jgi:hypothetical protein
MGAELAVIAPIGWVRSATRRSAPIDRLGAMDRPD